MTEKDVISVSEKYVNAWNTTMIQMWQEQITLLGVIDTRSLLGSLTALPVQADGRMYEIHLAQTFKEYGIWQEFGVGKEVKRGNKGDIGRAKVRQRKPWFSKAYYKSVMALKDFLAASIGEEFVGIVCNALNNDTIRRITEYNRRNKH